MGTPEWFWRQYIRLFADPGRETGASQLRHVCWRHSLAFQEKETNLHDKNIWNFVSDAALVTCKVANVSSLAAGESFGVSRDSGDIRFVAFR